MGNALPLNQVRAGAHCRLVRVLAILGAVLLAGTGHRAAADIPQAPTPAHILAELAFNFTPPEKLFVTTFGEHQLFGPGGRLRIDSALFPSPFLHASVVDIRDNYFGRVAASLNYEVLIVGPDGSVPVIFGSSGEVAGNALPPPLGSGSFTLKATWSLSNVAGGTPLFLEGGIVTPQRSDAFFDSFDDLVTLSLTANQRISVTLVADVGIANGFTNGASGSARAFVDPVFSFAPGVGPEYSFVFSPGVGNLPISAVPEPPVFVLMAAGLLTVALRLRPGRRGRSRGDGRDS